jgi:glycosyltransferase involved in cell wall biosynthesis
LKSSVEHEILRDLDSNILNLTVKYDASEEEKFNLLSQSKVYVSLSKDENFSIAAMEAASMGCVLILSDYSFFRDIYGEGAIYVDEDSGDKIWKNITNALNNQRMLEEYSDLAIKIASKYLVENVARQDYELVLKNIMDREFENET